MFEIKTIKFWPVDEDKEFWVELIEPSHSQSVEIEAMVETEGAPDIDPGTPQFVVWLKTKEGQEYKKRETKRIWDRGFKLLKCCIVRVNGLKIRDVEIKTADDFCQYATRALVDPVIAECFRIQGIDLTQKKTSSPPSGSTKDQATQETNGTAQPASAIA